MKKIYLLLLLSFLFVIPGKTQVLEVKKSPDRMDFQMHITPNQELLPTFNSTLTGNYTVKNPNELANQLEFKNTQAFYNPYRHVYLRTHLGILAPNIVKPHSGVNPSVPHFRFTTQSACANTLTRFSLQTNLLPDSCSFDFGDGTTVTTPDTFINHKYSKAGNYKVEMQFYLNGIAYSYCKEVAIKGNKRPSLSDDFSICKGDSLFFGDEEALAAKWSSGDSSKTLWLKQDGWQFVQLTYEDCEVIDSFLINYKDSNFAVAIYGANSILCKGDEQLVSLANGYETWQKKWSTGDSSLSINLSKGGNYQVQVQKEGCIIGNAQWTVNEKKQLWLNYGADETLCLDLDSLFLDHNSEYEQYFWFPTGDSSQWVSLRKAGSKFEIIQDFNGCTDNDRLTISSNCNCVAFVANAFTPNSDGLNEVFQPVIDCEVENYRFEIYNRWGQKIFVSQNPHAFWEAVNLPSDYYTWLLRYQAINTKKIYFYSGNVLLIR